MRVVIRLALGTRRKGKITHISAPALEMLEIKIEGAQGKLGEDQGSL
jgi:hypothetical protein